MSKDGGFGWDKITFFQKIKNIKHIDKIIIAIFIVIIGILFLSSNNTKGVNEEVVSSSLEEYTDYLEKKLQNVIKNIDGAGEVSVMLTFAGRIEYEYAKESEETTTSSNITSGSNSKTTVNEKVIIVNQNGKNMPLIVKEIYPNIGGVVVVASGAKDVSVRLNIINAVQTVLDVSPSKIQVLVGT